MFFVRKWYNNYVQIAIEGMGLEEANFGHREGIFGHREGIFGHTEGNFGRKPVKPHGTCWDMPHGVSV